jgi:hypothetical protein
MLDSGGGEVVAAYQNTTGTRVFAAMMDLCPLWWDLAEIAIYIAQFRAPTSIPGILGSHGRISISS